MEIIMVKIELIKPYEKNAKKHSKEQIQKVANSIKRFGFVQPLVLDKNNEIIIGHCRYEAGLLLKLDEVPCVMAENLSDEEVKALRLADNKLNESAWDMDLVINELKLLTPELLDLSGFDKDLVIEPDDKDDEVPDVPEEPTAKLGDIYQLCNHRIMCGDSTKIEDVEKLMGGNKADMVFTDPPYGMNYDGSLCTDGTKLRKAKLIGDETEEVLELVLDNLRLFCKGAWYICYHRVLMWKAFLAIMENKMRVRNVIIWKKQSINLSNSDYKSLYEPIIVGWADDYIPIFYGWNENHNFYGKRGEKDVWELEAQSIWEINKSKHNDKHPTMKPVELVCRAIMNSSKKDEIVMDLFLGSGTTLIASEKTNRTCYGMELDPKYCDVIIKRWEDYTGNKAEKIN